MYKLHTKCRVCGNTNLESVADFGATPLANDFKTKSEEHCGFAPLDVLFCDSCSLAQLSVVVNPKILYSNYSYVSSNSKTMVSHMEQLISDIKSESSIRSVLEIGSNTGVFLRLISGKGASYVHGIDPAQNLAKISTEIGIPTTVGFWSRKLAEQSGIRSVDVVIARHVFAHVDDWREFIDALEVVTWEKSLVVIEVPYVGNLLKGNEWDSVYHEHLSYVSIRSINRLLRGTRWQLSSVKRYSIHGGSIALFLRRRSNSDRTVMDDVFESKQFKHSSNGWKSMASTMMSELSKGPVRRVFGYGAPAKATLWTSHLGLSSKHVEFVHDETPQKQGRFMPGTDIPVIDGRDRMKLFDTGIIFAWNFADEIIRKEEWFEKQGGRFIVPFKPYLTGKHA